MSKALVPKRSRRTSWTVAAVSLIVSLVAAEAFLRVLARREHARLAQADPHREFCAMRAADPELIYTYVPNRPGCETNSRGYRDHEHSFEKPNDVFRIVIIGDSIAEGWGVPLEATFGRVVERQAAGELARRTESVILARQGYSTSQELVLLRNEALKYHPDVIVWSYALNDPADPVFHNANSETGRYFFRPRIFLAQLLRKAAFNLREKIYGRSCDREYHRFLHCVYWAEVETHLDEIGRIARRSGVPTLFLIHPVFEQSSFEQYSLNDLHRKLSARAFESGLIPLDGLECYRGHPPDEFRLHRAVDDPWHPNPAGHTLIGRCLLRPILRIARGEAPPGD